MGLWTVYPHRAPHSAGLLYLAFSGRSLLRQSINVQGKSYIKPRPLLC